MDSSVKISDKLKKLNEDLILEGCNNYICGINNACADDAVCFDKVKDKWEIYYTERGMKGEIFFSSNDIQTAQTLHNRPVGIRMAKTPSINGRAAFRS
jgi:hypothetical protein